MSEFDVKKFDGWTAKAIRMSDEPIPGVTAERRAQIYWRLMQSSRDAKEEAKELLAEAIKRTPDCEGGGGG